MKVRLSPVTAVTCDAEFRVLENAEIHVEDGRLRYVGPAADAPSFEADETIGGEHMVAIPGLINTHTHVAMTLLRGYADDMALEPWLQDRIWPFEANLTADDIYRGTLLGAAEMLRGGTTCCADLYFQYEQMARAYVESGMRACPGAAILGFLPEPDRRIAEAVAFVEAFTGAGDDRIRPVLAPHSLYTCQREHWEPIIEAAHRLGAAIHTHAAETRTEVADVTAAWGSSPIRALHELGALDTPLPLVAAHCVHVDEEEIELLAANNAAVAHNPTSNLKLASGFAPVPAMLAAGVTVGLAPDGPASNNRLDMWREMRMAALIHKAVTGDPTAVPARNALEMATIDSARTLGLEDEVGSLEAGKKADVVLMDFDKPHLYPRHDVVSHLVYAVGAADVDTVLVDGRVLLRGGAFTELDASRIQADAQSAAERLTREAESQPDG